MNKKKKRGFIFYCLFFLAAIMAEIYCLLEFRDDLITVGGIGIVTLIGAYFVLDAMIKDESESRKKVLPDTTQDRIPYEALYKKLENLEQIDKALYVAVKKNTSVLEKELDLIKENQTALMDKLIVNQEKCTKAVLKYNKDNIDYILDNVQKRPAEEKTPEKEPQQLPDTSDPNKQLSPEEIAALFNQAGQ